MSVDMSFIKPFIDGTIHTLKVQCSTEVQYGKPFLKENAPKESKIEIAGIVGIISQSFKGSISLSFPGPTFLNVMGKMLDETYTSITPEVEDGAGELINIIFGYGKRVLNEQGHDLQKSLPSVITGANIRVRHVSNESVIILPFTSALGDFQLEVGIEVK